MLAADKGHVGVCKLLLRYGADVDVKDLQGNTASSLAISNGFNNLGQRLSQKTVSKDADKN
eukprot:TRINITY_DN5651_c0_g1_i1.p1 TRINITY_DN5651_c0_g1~~TRINITY_DN5651_c0_g1_i1.p1  ORF type:complete len:61 (+),score=13.57 TRINITY_DN5651_c0_g1_i1:167-349(+)